MGLDAEGGENKPKVPGQRLGKNVFLPDAFNKGGKIKALPQKTTHEERDAKPVEPVAEKPMPPPARAPSRITHVVQREGGIFEIQVSAQPEKPVSSPEAAADSPVALATDPNRPDRDGLLGVLLALRRRFKGIHFGEEIAYAPSQDESTEFLHLVTQAFSEPHLSPKDIKKAAEINLGVNLYRKNDGYFLHVGKWEKNAWKSGNFESVGLADDADAIEALAAAVRKVLKRWIDRDRITFE